MPSVDSDGIVGNLTEKVFSLYNLHIQNDLPEDQGRNVLNLNFRIRGQYIAHGAI